MKKKRGIKIKLSNRWLYTFIVLGILAIVGIGVYAYGTSSPSTFGHSSGEINVDNTLCDEVTGHDCGYDNYEANTDYCSDGRCSGNLNVLGYLSTSRSPTSNSHVTTKAYVDAQIAAIDIGPNTWECVTESRTRSISSRRHEVSISCSSGYNLITGGCSISGEPRANDYINSYPLENGWYCSVLDDYQKNSITAYARCCK
jgi:hypothetical protein